MMIPLKKVWDDSVINCLDLIVTGEKTLSTKATPQFTNDLQLLTPLKEVDNTT